MNFYLAGFKAGYTEENGLDRPGYYCVVSDQPRARAEALLEETNRLLPAALSPNLKENGAIDGVRTHDLRYHKPAL